MWQVLRVAQAKLEVVASDQTFSARFDGGRARIDPSVWSSVVASKSPLVSAPAFPSMPGASQRAPHAQSDLLTCILHFDSWMYRRLPHILWKLVTRRV